MPGHKKFVVTVQRVMGPQLEVGETVQEACAGLTESPPVSMVSGMIALVKMIGGDRPEGRLVVLTDRSLHLARSRGAFGVKSAEMMRSFPRAGAAAHVRLSGDTLTVGDEDVIVTAIASRQAAKRINAALVPDR
jgi:hypothetical protein